MQKISYYCDGGSVAINCGGSIIRIPNFYGDCSSYIYLMDSEQELNSYVEGHKQYFNSEIGDCMRYLNLFHLDNAKVLNYDFPTNTDPCETGVILNGDYHVYAWNKKVYFVKVV